MFLEGKQYTELETLYDKIEETSSELLTILSKHEDELDAMERMEGTTYRYPGTKAYAKWYCFYLFSDCSRTFLCKIRIGSTDRLY